MIPPPPPHRDELLQWLPQYPNLQISPTTVFPHPQSPLHYTASAFFEPSPDQIVWAPRSGGKTTLAAAATLLDLLYKPGCNIRILGGSLDQSLRMWEYILPHIETFFPDLYPRNFSRTIRLP